MNKKLKGFSLAELLISLLIISIVLSAAIPTLTKKSAGSEQIWRWANNSNNSAYFGVGALQTAIIGNDMVPDVTNTWGTMEGIDSTTSGIRYTTSGDKLVLMKQSTSDNANSHLMNSHISFYTLANNASASTNDIMYTGRLALDRHNIALGIGSLQSLNDTSATFLGDNTAIGHYTLFRNKSGAFNTAIGEAALANNIYAKHNTAVGYQAGLSIDKDSTSDDDDTNAIQNTIVGSQALKTSKKGRSNTAIGYAALATHTNGIGSTAVGSEALRLSYGTGNTAFGTNACYRVEDGSYNLCLGLGAGEIINQSSNSLVSNKGLNKSVKYGLFIGSSPNDGVANTKISDAPLIFGRMQHIDDSHPREIVFNTANTEIRTFDGTYPLFKVSTKAGSDGATNGGDYTGYLSLTTYMNNASATTGQSAFHISGDVNTVYVSANDNNNGDKDLAINSGILRINTSTSGSNKNLNLTSTALNADLFNNRIYIGSNNTTRKARIDFESAGNLVMSSAANTSMSNPASITLSGASDNISLSAQNVRLGRNNQINIVNSNVNYNATLNMQGYDIEMTSLGSSGNSLRKNITDLWNAIFTLRASDARLKNISGDNTAGLKEINALEVKNYTYKNDEKKVPHVGVIAQQLQKIFPNSVTENNEGYLMIRTEEIFYAMVNSIKELCSQIQDLTAKITGLDKRITELENENAILKKQNEEFEKRLTKLEKKIK